MDQTKQTVLVVDDDPDILRLVTMILQRLQLTVFAAGNAEEALRVMQELPTPPDLLLTDVVMPGVSGPLLAEKVLALSPAVRVLFMSGFENLLITTGSVIPIIPKPFTFEGLGQKVKEVLRDTQ